MSDTIENNDDMCFVCGKNNDGGMHLVFIENKRDKTVTCMTKVDSKYQGWNNIVHGGIIALLLDEAFGNLAGSCGFLAVTGELNVRYKAPLPVDTVIRIFAEVEKQTSLIIYVKGRIESEDGRIYSTGKAKMVIKQEI